MKLQYLGTAAAEGWPALFCTCDACQQAAQAGGKNIRTRSQALVNNTLLLDFPPDTYYHYLTNHFPLPQLEHVFITHDHSDHFYPEDLIMRGTSYSWHNKTPLTVYGNETVEKHFLAATSVEDVSNRVVFQRLTAFKTVSVADHQVTPLLALHDRSEECFIYLIEDGENTLLYAHDTGVFPEATWDYLQGKRVDIVSMDCTTGKFQDGKNHMGVLDAIQIKTKLQEQGIIHENTTFILSHFSHNGIWLHDTLEETVTQENMLVAYDGMIVQR